MCKYFRHACKRLLGCNSGNVAMVFALSALPLIGMAGLASDTARIVHARTKTQAIADAASLAAAAANVSLAEKERIALAYATANLSKIYGVTATPTVSVSGENVSVTIRTVVRGTLLSLVFPQRSGVSSSSTSLLPTVDFTVRAASLGEAGSSYEPCLIALNTSMEEAIYIRGNGEFLAKECAVLSNSTSDAGMVFQGNANAASAAFLSAGKYQKNGNSGSVTPTPLTGQNSIADPINLAVTSPGGTAVAASVKKSSGNVSLSAAIYSDITLRSGAEATFTPGVHYITGTLSLGSQSTLNGAGVTIVLLGPNAKIDMNSGGTLKLSAPTSGTYPGYAVIGDTSNFNVLTNTIQGGASGYVRGIWYTPRHKLYVTGNGDFNTTAGYFPVIADNVEIGGNGSFQTGMDWKSYGYPEPTALTVATRSKVSLTD